MIFQNLIFIAAFYLTVCGAQIETAAGVSVVGVDGTKPCAQEGDLKYLGNVATKQFFVFNNKTLISWQDAVAKCIQSGMVLVKISNKAEMDFVNKQVVTNKIGPVWFGARDLGGRSSYKWTTNVNVGSQLLDTSVNFSDFLENGPLALQMNLAVSNDLFPSPSYLKSAKPFCQSYTTYY